MTPQTLRTISAVCGIISAVCAVVSVIMLAYTFWMLTYEPVTTWLRCQLRGQIRRARRVYRRFGKPPLTQGYIWSDGEAAESLGGECPNCWRGEFGKIGTHDGKVMECRICYHKWDVWSDPWQYAGCGEQFNTMRMHARYHQHRQGRLVAS